MSVTQRQNDIYGLSQPIIKGAPAPINSQRAPTASDFATPGTIWTNKLTNTVYILASIVANSATWIAVAPAAGAGVFTSLTVNPGPTNLTGAFNIVGGPSNIAGAVTMSNGNLTLQLGELIMPVGDIQLKNTNILSGAGDPNGVIVAPQGSLFLREDGAGVDSRAYISIDGLGTWAAIVTDA